MRDAMIKRWPRSIPSHLAVCLLAITGGVGAAKTNAQTLPAPVDGSTTALGSPMPLMPAANLASISHSPAPSVLQVLTSARRGFCARVRVSPVCQLVTNLRKPLSVVTGGLVAAEKVPHADDQAQPGPEGTAAQLKAVNLQAPKRRAAVRDLQGMDVRYHPEAESILIAALRVDPSECVRYEAAITIATLVVCTEPIAKALRTCIDSSARDGNPAELSLRVRAQAAAALAKCECCLPEAPNDVQQRPEYPVSQNFTGGEFQPGGMPHPVAPVQWPIASQTAQHTQVEVAGWYRVVDEDGSSPVQTAAATELPAVTDNRPKNLFEVFKSARENPSNEARSLNR